VIGLDVGERWGRGVESRMIGAGIYVSAYDTKTPSPTESIRPDQRIPFYPHANYPKKQTEWGGGAHE